MSRNRSLPTLALSLVLTLIAACARNPVSGRHELTLISESKERELGAEEAKKVAAGMGLIEDPALVGYVRTIGARLVAMSPRPGVEYTFHVVDMVEPNAFALPGGYVYVSRGLLALVNSEDELAGILGHEVAHVAARHAVQRVSRAAPIGIVTGLGAAVTGIVSPMLGNVVGAVGQLAGGLVLAPYSRDQEREADRVGAWMAARAGWDPTHLAGALHTLEREEALRGRDPNRVSFFATHPALPERVGTVRDLASKLDRGAGAPIAATRAAFIDRIAGVVVGPRAAEGVFVGRRFVHPDLDFTLTFPEEWETRNAETAVAARAPSGKSVVALELLGKGNDPSQAVAAFEKESGESVASRVKRITVNGSPAARLLAEARTNDGPMGIHLTWIARNGLLYRVIGAAPMRDFATVAPSFDKTVDSFRVPTAAERAGVREHRLRGVTARTGESLEAFVLRSRGTWAADMTAVANGLEADRPVPAGMVVKVPISARYSSR